MDHCKKFLLPRHRLSLNVFFMIVLSVLIPALFWHAPKWWSSDDLQILKHAITNKWLEWFFSPEVWSELSRSNLTPWVSLSYRIDYWLFGFNPLPFYLHQWFSLGLLLALFYMLCRNWLTPFSSASAVLVLLLSRPVMMAGHVLWIRHYVEGLIFALVATLFFLRADTNNTVKYWGGFFFLLACTAKEIYVPLPIVLLFLPITDIRDRLVRLWPMLLGITLYVMWRFWMLKGLGGYGKGLNLNDIFELPKSILLMTGFNNVWSCILGLTFIFLWLWQSTRQWKIFVIMMLGASTIPLIPVSGMMDVRYILLHAVLLSLLIGWVVHQSHRWSFGTIKGCGIAVASVLLIVLLFQSNLQDWRRYLLSDLKKIRTEGIYLLKDGNEGEYLVHTGGPPWFYSGLEWFRSHVMNRDSGPKILFDEYDILNSDRDSSFTGYFYSNDNRRLEKISNTHEIFKKLYGELKEQEPLHLKMTYSDETLTWFFGPWEEGRYTILMNEASFDMPHQGSHSVSINDNVFVRLRYISPDNWRTYSPKLLLKIDNGKGRLHWKNSNS